MKVFIAKPRGFCAGVERAIEIVEQAIQLYGAPIYVRHNIVHNERVVNELAKKGARFVETLAEVPEGSRVIFSAHGVSPDIYKDAKKRNLEIIDAVCPLVTKVHEEVRRYAKRGYTIILVGHKNHVEVIGTRGEAPEQIIVVSSVAEAKALSIPDPEKVAHVTQTTLSIDDTKEIIDVLQKRFPKIIGPSKSDICYATQNRQGAVKKLAALVDIIYIIGSHQSSNSKRLVEVAKSCGKPAYLIENANWICQEMLGKAQTIGISSGASTPKVTIQEVIAKLKEFGAEIEEVEGVEESVHFNLPQVLTHVDALKKENAQ